MTKEKILKEIKKLEKSEYGAFYSDLDQEYQLDIDIVNAFYPYVLGSEEGGDLFKQNIRAFYALEFKWVIRVLEHEGSDSWILAFVDPSIFYTR